MQVERPRRKTGHRDTYVHRFPLHSRPLSFHFPYTFCTFYFSSTFLLSNALSPALCAFFVQNFRCTVSPFRFLFLYSKVPSFSLPSRFFPNSSSFSFPPILEILRSFSINPYNHLSSLCFSHKYHRSVLSFLHSAFVSVSQARRDASLSTSYLQLTYDRHIFLSPFPSPRYRSSSLPPSISPHPFQRVALSLFIPRFSLHPPLLSLFLAFLSPLQRAPPSPLARRSASLSIHRDFIPCSPLFPGRRIDRAESASPIRPRIHVHFIIMRCTRYKPRIQGAPNRTAPVFFERGGGGTSNPRQG